MYLNEQVVELFDRNQLDIRLGYTFFDGFWGQLDRMRKTTDNWIKNQLKFIIVDKIDSL